MYDIENILLFNQAETIKCSLTASGSLTRNPTGTAASKRTFCVLFVSSCFGSVTVCPLTCAAYTCWIRTKWVNAAGRRGVTKLRYAISRLINCSCHPGRKRSLSLRCFHMTGRRPDCVWPSSSSTRVPCGLLTFFSCFRCETKLHNVILPGWNPSMPLYIWL